MSHLKNLEIFLQQNTEDFIIDTNAIRAEWRDMDILEYLYECRHPSEIRNEFLEETLFIFKGFREIIKLPNVCIIEEVKEETRNLERKFSECLSHHKRKAKIEKNIYKIKLMEDINEEIFEFIREMKKNIIRPYGDFYESILDGVERISDEYEKIARKYEREYLGFPRKKPKLLEYFGTDEKLIAAALHKSIMDDKDISIITNDDNLSKKFKISYKLLSCPDLYYNLEGLNGKILKVYRINLDDEIRPSKNTMGIASDHFEMHHLSPEENKKLKYDIDNMLYRGQKENDRYAKP